MNTKEELISIGDIVPNKFNPNKMSEEKRTELKASMQKEGQKQPIIVRKIREKVFELIDGENRWSIAKELKLVSLRATIEEVTDTQAMRLCYAINSARGSMDAFAEAKFFDLLAQKGMKTDALAKEYNLSEKFIEDRRKLLSINAEQKEALLKKIPKGTEMTGAHWLAYANATPEERIGACKHINRDFVLTPRDIEEKVKRAREEIKERKEFESALEKTDFKNCPTCKKKAVKLSWDKKFLVCEEFHDWDPKTGKKKQAIITSEYTKKEKVKKPKFLRNFFVKVDFAKACTIAQSLALKNLDKISNISFYDKQGNIWNIGINQGWKSIDISKGNKQTAGTTYKLQEHGKKEFQMRGPAYDEITKKMHGEMLVWAEVLGAKVTDPRLVKKENKKEVKKDAGKN